MNIKIPIKNLPISIRQNIIKDYEINGFSSTKLSKKYKYSVVAILKFLRNNIPMRTTSQAHQKYQIDDNYFNIIDTEEKAYFLGFLYADGYLNDKTKSITLQLAKMDKEILIKLNKSLRSDRPLLFVDCENHRNKTGLNIQDAYRLCINNIKIFNDLKNLGLFQKKSLTLIFPNEYQISKPFLRHFIRGYFDGDGSLSISMPKRRLTAKTIQADLTILSTKEFVDRLGELISQEIGITWNLTKRFNNDVNCYNFKLSGNFQILKFLDYIYNGSTIKLERKFNKFLKLINMVYERENHKGRKHIIDSHYLSSLIKI